MDYVIEYGQFIIGNLFLTIATIFVLNAENRTPWRCHLAGTGVIHCLLCINIESIITSCTIAINTKLYLFHF